MNLHHQVVGVRYAHEYLDPSTLETKPGGEDTKLQVSWDYIANLRSALVK